MGGDWLFMLTGVWSRYWRWRVWDGRRYGRGRGEGKSVEKGLVVEGCVRGWLIMVFACFVHIVDQCSGLAARRRWWVCLVVAVCVGCVVRGAQGA